MKYKKYLTMFLAGTMVLGSVPAAMAEQGTASAIESSNEPSAEGESDSTGEESTELAETEESSTEEVSDSTEEVSAEENTEEITDETESTDEAVSEEDKEEEVVSDEENTEETTDSTEEVTDSTTTDEITDEVADVPVEEPTEEVPVDEVVPDDVVTDESIGLPAFDVLDLNAENGIAVMANVGVAGIETPDGKTIFRNDSEVQVTLTSSSEGDVIFYTTDGSDPRTSSTRERYTDPFTVKTYRKAGETITITYVSAQGEEGNYKYSPVVSQDLKFLSYTEAPFGNITGKYFKTATTLDSFPTNNTFDNRYELKLALTDTLSDGYWLGADGKPISYTEKGVKLYYTTDGTDPKTSETRQEATEDFYSASYDKWYKTLTVKNDTDDESTVQIKAVEAYVTEGEEVYGDYVADYTFKFKAAAVLDAPKLTVEGIDSNKYAPNGSTVTVKFENPNTIDSDIYYVTNAFDSPLTSDTRQLLTGDSIEVKQDVEGKWQSVTIRAVAVPKGGGKNATASSIARTDFYFSQALPQVTDSIENGEYRAEAVVSNNGIRYGGTTAVYSKYRLVLKNMYLEKTDEGITLKTPVNVSTGVKGVYLASDTNKENNLLGDVLYTETNANNGKTYNYNLLTLPVADLNEPIHIIDSKNNNLYIKLSKTPVKADEYTVSSDNFTLQDVAMQSERFAANGKYFFDKNGSFIYKYEIVHNDGDFSNGYYQTYYTLDGSDVTEENKSVMVGPTIASPITNSIQFSAEHYNKESADSSSQKMFIEPSYEDKTVVLKMRMKIAYYNWDTNSVDYIWTNQLEKTFEYAGMGDSYKEDEATGVIFDARAYTNLNYSMPHDATFTVNAVESDSEKSALLSRIKENGVDTSAMFAYNVSFKNPDGSEAQAINLKSGHQYWYDRYEGYELDVPAQDGFNCNNMKIYKIEEDGTIRRLAQKNEENADGLKFVSVTVNDMPLSGTYIYIQDETVSKNVKDGTYTVETSFTDSNKKPLADKTAYIDGRAVLDVANGNRTLYLPFTAEGKVTSVKVYNGSTGGYENAEFKDVYTVDGQEYAKVAVCGIDKTSSYTKAKVTIDGTEYDVNITLNLNRMSGSDSVKTTAPVLTTETGKDVFVNDATANVIINSYGKGSKVYYTTDGTEPTSTNGILWDGNIIPISTTNKEGEVITLKAIAYTDDYAVSDVSTMNLTFVAEGQAVENVNKPKINFTNDYGIKGLSVVTITLDGDYEGTKIYYTTDGSTPSPENGTLYDGGSLYIWTIDGTTGEVVGDITVKAIAYADGYLPSEVNERTFRPEMTWWDKLNDGEYTGVKLRLRNYTVPTSLSMGNSALAGTGTLVVDGNERYMWVDFQPMNLGGMPAWLRHMWYFDSEDDGNKSPIKSGNTDEQNLWHEGEYQKEYESLEGAEISSAKIKLYGTETALDEQIIAIESNFLPMGIQKALLDIDYSALSGGTKEEELEAPTVSFVQSEDKQSMTISISAAEGADIYYVVTDYVEGDTVTTPEQTEENKYTGPFVIEKTSNIKTVNAIAVKDGKTSLVATQKIIFESDSDTVKDGEYTADISILSETTDAESMAKDYFTTTAAPVTVKNGQYSVKLVYSTPLITALAQENGDSYESLEVIEENGKKYVVVNLGDASTAKKVQMSANMGGTVRQQVFRVALKKDTLKPVEEAQEKTYSVPVRMVQAANPDVESMGNAALDGNATITVKDGKSYIDLKFKAVTYLGLYGHLLKLWGYPENQTAFDSKWWNNANSEIAASAIEYYEDYGMGYTSGDTTKSQFVRKFRMERNAEKEDVVYIRISADAMSGFDQPARLEFDWDNAQEIETEDKNIISAPTVTPEKEEANANETVKVVIGTATEGADIYYTTDGSTPTEKSTKYTEGFTVTGNGETVTINAIAVKDGKTSTVGSAAVKFAKAGSNSGSDTDTIEDGKYWMEFNLWNATVDQASMGNVAFDNNRKALVTISGGKATIEVATNPVNVSGYTSALKDLKSNSTDITVLDRDEFTTNEKYDGKEHSFDYIKRFSFTIDDLDTEFVDVKISVPYTPMDGISANVGGWIDARFKLDFGSLEAAGKDATLIPNSSTASGSSSGGGGAVSKSDEATGIKIEADEFVFEDGTEFESKEVKDGNSYKSAESALGEKYPDFKLYDISAKVDGTKIEPAGQADVYFPVIEGVGKDGIKIFRITEGSAPSNAEKTELEFTLSSDGKYYVVKVKELGLFAIAYDKTIAPDAPVEEVKPDETVDTTNTSFADVENHWAKEYIKKAVEKGLFKGISENEFAPDTATTRGMLITVLGRMDNVKAGQFKTDKFTDVKEDDYFAPFVAWGVSNGIVSGMSENEFAPNDNITREQLAVMLYNYAKFKGIDLGGDKEVSFADGETVSGWAKEAVEALSKAGIMSGRDNGNFDPKANATRAEAATMLVNFVDSYMTKQAEETVTEEA